MARAVVLGGTCLCLAFASGVAFCQQASLVDHFAKQGSVLPSLGGQIRRMDLDLTGDGQPELLLANTQTAGMSGEQGWFVYSKVADRQYRFIGDAEFSYLLFRLTDDGSRLVAYRKTAIGSGAITTYRVDATGFHEEARKEGVVVGTDDWKQFEEWRKAVRLKVLATEFSDLNNPSPTWTDIIAKEPATGVSSIHQAVVVE